MRVNPTIVGGSNSERRATYPLDCIDLLIEMIPNFDDLVHKSINLMDDDCFEKSFQGLVLTSPKAPLSIVSISSKSRRYLLRSSAAPELTLENDGE